MASGVPIEHRKIPADYPFDVDAKIQNERIFEMKYKTMKKEITYTEYNGIFYPDIRLPEQTAVKIGKYGRVRLDYLKTHRKGQYTTLLTQGVLAAHLVAIDAAARYLVEKITANLAKERGIDENLKATDLMRWVQEMNNCKFIAEEVALQEVIYQ